MVLRLTLLEHLLHRLHLLPMPVMDAFASVLYGRALAIGVRRGIFETVSGGPVSAEDIAARTHLDVKAVELLLEAFVQGGYLTHKSSGFTISSHGRTWLLKSSPRYIGNLVGYFETLHSRWGYLEYSLEHGHPPKPYYEMFEEKDWEVYVHGMHDLALLLMDDVKRQVVFDGAPKSLLDLGGSHGAYAMECCRRYPTLRAVVMDFEPAVRHAKPIIQQEGMTDRVSALAGNFTKESLPGNQDAVLMFNIIHGFTEAENVKLISRALGVLNMGGKLFILDQLKRDRRTSSRQSLGSLSRFIPLMVGLNLLNEIGGNTYTFEQVKDWCVGASSVRRIGLRFPGVELVEIRK